MDPELLQELVKSAQQRILKSFALKRTLTHTPCESHKDGQSGICTCRLKDCPTTELPDMVYYHEGISTDS